ncbi:MAG: hypothetical protein EA409_13335 [Saprospirales bacterium]|nr:MAG: hypothetical protein EA409_13335 [Saprospirales bacterium]
MRKKLLSIKYFSPLAEKTRFPFPFVWHLFVWIILSTMTFSSAGYTQNVYEMQDLVVFDCEGIFTDSNNGAEEGQYAHNENYTFTICVQGATEIIVVFDYFATEANFDILSVYDGPDTSSPLIAQLSGTLQPPPTLLALSGCITFHFVSDENIAAIGWQASWSVEIEDPQPPNLQLPTSPDCPMYMASFYIDDGIPCDLLINENFSLVGPSTANILDVIPIDCDDETGLAQNFEVFFDPPPEVTGNYRLFFSGILPDNCGNNHEVESNLLFLLENCPLKVEIVLVDGPGCPGECIYFSAVVSGGSGNYSYSWNFTASNTDIVSLCPELTTEVTLLVTDNNGGNTGEAFFVYTPLESPAFLNPLQSDTFCASRGDHIFQMSITGGEFYSEIIPNAHRQTGRYQFWRWRTEEEPLNRDIITYFAPNGCSVSDTVYVRHIRSGDREAACLGADPWVVSGGFPNGGYWSGPHIDSSGLFFPEVEGSFLITYNALNGCSESKRVDVGAELMMPDIDTICSSQLYFLEASIYGGRWYGPGITNRINGRLEPWRAAPNESYTYTYILEGCEAEIEIYIKELYAGGEITLCSADSLLLLPVSGDWSGPGEFISTENAFDISSLNPGEYEFTLSLGGCQDILTLYLTDVQIGSYNPTFFCPDHPPQYLWSFLWVHPWGGDINGNGIVNVGGEWYFDPTIAGPGEHYVYFENLGCRDSVLLTVDQYAEIPEYWFCDRNNPTILTADPPGGQWSGPGFLNPTQGLFDPSLAGTGSHEVVYTAPSGCRTLTVIEVAEFEEVSIEGIERRYCYFDSLIQISLLPSGGEFTINGLPSEAGFSPAMLGTGIHEFLYRRGEGVCSSSERLFITVLNPLSVQSGLENDTICAGSNVVLEVIASGGVGGLTYNWGGSLGFGNSQIIFPDSSAWYSVRVEDNCSEPLQDSVYVHVNPLPDISYTTGPSVCFGEYSYIEVYANQNVPYHFLWLTDSLREGPRLIAGPGNYILLVEDQGTGCSEEYSLTIPGPGALSANFSTIPNQPCIDLINNRLEVINLSFGHERIWLDFGDGTGLHEWTDEDLIFHYYNSPGEYTIHLYVENGLGCRDTIERDICVENAIRLFIPNAFSPNGDGNNDHLEIYGIGVDENLHWQIYDRYGARVFESFRKSDTWDGTFQAKELPAGPYLLIAQYRDMFSGEEFQIEQLLYLIR